MWILIRWLHQKPADLDLQCFQIGINLGSAGQGLIKVLLAAFYICHLIKRGDLLIIGTVGEH